MTATSKWELGYENCQRHHRNVMELISNRSKVSKSSSAYANFTDQISSLLQGLQSELEQLRSELPNAGLTRGERQRREALVEAMSSKEKQLRVLFSQVKTSS
jgi:Skp family chaperone for outer membrane proteins